MDYMKGENTENVIETIPLLREECLEAFELWDNKDNKIDYDPR